MTDGACACGVHAHLQTASCHRLHLPWCARDRCRQCMADTCAHVLGLVLMAVHAHIVTLVAPGLSGGPSAAGTASGCGAGGFDAPPTCVADLCLPGLPAASADARVCAPATDAASLPAWPACTHACLPGVAPPPAAARFARLAAGGAPSSPTALSAAGASPAASSASGAPRFVPRLAGRFVAAGAGRLLLGALRSRLRFVSELACASLLQSALPALSRCAWSRACLLPPFERFAVAAAAPPAARSVLPLGCPLLGALSLRARFLLVPLLRTFACAGAMDGGASSSSTLPAALLPPVPLRTFAGGSAPCVFSASSFGSASLPASARA